MCKQRKAREEARLKALEEKKEEEKRQQEAKRKNDFLARANMFQQKKGPTDEEIKQKIQKESQERKFERKLNKVLSTNPDKNPLATELAMRGKAVEVEKVAQSGITESDSANKPPPPPPPPQRVKVMIKPEENEIQQNESPSTNETTENESSKASSAYVFSGWVYVFENEVTPYYWNVNTNETSFYAPKEYKGELYTSNGIVYPENTNGGENTSEASEVTAANDLGDESASNQQVVLWREVSNEETGEIYYVNTADESLVVIDRPLGDVFITSMKVINEETGETAEENWQEFVNEDTVMYRSLLTDEIVAEKPIGITIVAQTIQ